MSLEPAEFFGLTYVMKIHPKPDLLSGYVRKTEMYDKIAALVHTALEPYNAHHFLKWEDISKHFFEMMIEHGAIEIRNAPFAGDYFRFAEKSYQAMRTAYLTSDTYYLEGKELGERYYQDAFSALAAGEVSASEGDRDIELEHDGSEVGIPASDRVVTLNHNQIVEIDKPLTELIELVEPENSIGNEVGLRELILGKLRSGRELIRAGVFSLQTYQITLIVGLKMIVERHQDTAISVAAAKLLDLLIAHYGIS